MQIDCRIRSSQHSVFVSVRFANDESVTSSFERRNISFFVGRVEQDEINIKNRLGNQTGN